MRNPTALTDEVLDKIESLLSSYDTALDNVLYKHFNPTEDQKAIREVRAALDWARNGPSPEETMDELMKDMTPD